MGDIGRGLVGAREQQLERHHARQRSSGRTGRRRLAVTPLARAGGGGGSKKSLTPIRRLRSASVCDRALKCVDCYPEFGESARRLYRLPVTRYGSATVIRTHRLIIRAWRVDEVDRFLDIYRRPEVVRWFPGEPVVNRQEAVQRIERNLSQLAADPRFGRWAVVDRSRGIPAGTVILQPLPDGDGEVEIGWHLHPDSWGRGFASEAARAVLERAFADGLSELWAVTDFDNRRSAAVCRRIGMRLLGVTHRWYHEPSLMFWAGCRPDQGPSVAPDGPPPSSEPVDSERRG